MSRVKCNYCDARASTPKRIQHSPGCPFREDMQRCTECGKRGEHAARCPLYLEKERAWLTNASR
jgi:hypothetical protein